MILKTCMLATIVTTSCFIHVYCQPVFKTQTIDANIEIGYGIALGDVDGDGKPDILLADKKQFVWYRNGDWKKFVMVQNLTEHDNVSIAARDINGDGKVEVAVGAQWNPGETANDAQSGAVHYLIRPEDPTQLWKPVELHHEPTLHRIQWAKLADGKYALLAAPLHGRGNKGGEGLGARFLAYHFPQNPEQPWQVDTLENSMHLTHNFFVEEGDNKCEIYLAGKEGVRVIGSNPATAQQWAGMKFGAGEIKKGISANKTNFAATIEPMHGNQVAVYFKGHPERILLDSSLREGHALAIGDFLLSGSDQVVAGWRAPDKDGKVGIKLYAMNEKDQSQWQAYWIDENGMACEDLKVMDLNADGKPDIIASGRATHNLKIYWNEGK